MNSYLSSHPSPDKPSCTHTRIGGEGVYGGSYCITNLAEFFKHYVKHVFVDNQLEYLTEKQLECGPIGIDIDLRYHEPKRAYSNDDIIDFVDILMDEINTLFNITENFDIYVFEKPNINVTPTQIKDGIHMIVSLNLDSASKSILRTRLLSKMDIWKNLKLANDWNSVLDENVFKGSTNWQLYGSRKPGHEAYQLSTVYTFNKEDQSYAIHSYQGSSFPVQTDFHKLSIRTPANETPSLKPEYMAEYEAAKQRKRPVVVHANPPSETIDTLAKLNAAIEKKLESFELAEYIAVDAHKYVMCLPETYYNDYDKWVRVGWALYHTHKDLFLSWVKFSSQSDKFSWGDIPKLEKQWNEFKRDNGLTIRSIMFWARTENVTEYNLIKEQSVDAAVDAIIYNSQECTEFDIADILFRLYKDRFICAELKNMRWYQYTHNRWIESEAGTDLRNQITSMQGVYGIFSKKRVVICNQITTTAPDDENYSKLKQRQKNIDNIMTRILKKHGDNIMKEASHKFYVPDFMRLLDSKNHILCFTNGVIDFSTNTFRQGMPEDFTHKYTHIPYLQESNPSIEEEINTFLHQLFPDDELFQYMYDHMASMLLGKNSNQTFNIYIGSGRNGKSKLIELLSNGLGDYKTTIPISIITKPRTNVGGASPEIAALVGIRLAVMQESSVNDRINEGPLKELTGGDSIQCRALYSKPITFVPQFKLVMATNNLPAIDGKDDGTWRRVRSVEFKSQFKEAEKIDPSSKYQFAVDKNIDENFKTWAPVFMKMLVERAFVTKGIVKDCAMVMVNSEKYRRDQDYLAIFMDKYVYEDPNGTLMEHELLEKFKEWWKMYYGDKRVMGKELFDHIHKKYAEHPTIKSKGTVWSGLKMHYEKYDAVEDI
jgi:P4 family phage/plasmid primase-like protien